MSWMKNRLRYVASDFDYQRLNPPLRTILKTKDGKQYEELLDESGWIAFGYSPQPTTRLGWFVYHTTHGLLMRYPLRSVIAFALLHSLPAVDKQSNEHQTTTMKDNRIDLWLNHVDLTALIQFAKRYRTSCQRVIEAALAQTVVGDLTNMQPLQGYERAERIPIRFDALGREQLETIAARTGLSHQDVLRLALHRLVENATVHAKKQNQ